MSKAKDNLFNDRREILQLLRRAKIKGTKGNLHGAMGGSLRQHTTYTYRQWEVMIGIEYREDAKGNETRYHYIECQRAGRYLDAKYFLNYLKNLSCAQ